VSDGGRVVDTPMHKGFVPTQKPYVEDERDGSGTGVPLDPGHRYCELIGSLLYIATTTRPDIAQAVGILSRYRCNTTTSHWNTAMSVLHYLRDTKDKVLLLGGNSSVVYVWVCILCLWRCCVMDQQEAKLCGYLNC
jgi:hypothetical protein